MDFVWLDVACIDQTAGSKDSTSEIGRQARIFKNAFCTFAWLTSHGEPCDEEYAEATFRLEQGVSEIMSQQPYSSQTVEADFASFLKFLTDDPWWTSLWTLQEAFLCPECIFLARNGEFWLKGNPGEEIPRLKEILMWFEFLTNFLQDSRLNLNLHRSPQIHGALEKSGLVGLLIGSPMVLLSVAHHRQATSELDRVYGIMQIFNFHLGVSRPGIDPKKKFTLDELEEELGQAILEHHPMMSQLHIFTRKPDRGKGWRIGQYSRMAADLNWDVYEHLDSPGYKVNPCVDFSTTLVDDVLWGTFSGRTSDLCEFQATWIAYDKLPNPWRPQFEIALDLPLPRRPVDDRNYHLDTSQALLASHPNAIILLLGSCEKEWGIGSNTARREPCHAVGLILVPRDSDLTPVQCWQRLGVLSWKLGEREYSAKMETYLDGASDAWKQATGVFG